MDIKINSAVQANDSVWDSLWRDCDYATYFHSREWAEIWAGCTDRKIHPQPVLIQFSDGAEALLPLSRKRILRGLTKYFMSSPAGTYGGWLSKDLLTIEHGRLLVDFICKKIGAVVWRLNPYDGLVSQLQYPVSENDETHALFLEKGFDPIYHSWTKGHKSAARKARKARKAGITIRPAGTRAHWEKYYELYEVSLHRWGAAAGSRYPFKLFEIMYDLSSENIRLWVAEYGHEIIAGALCFYAGKHVVYWHGAALASYFNLRPVNLLMYEIIEDACKRHYRWFDFNPSGGHEGVKAFKKSFGAVALPSPVVKVYPLWRTLFSKIKF